MGNRLVRKGLAIGVIVLFVCVGISSAVAIKEVNANNNDVINSSNAGSTEDLPDIKITYIETIPYAPDEHYPAVQGTTVGIKNKGTASLNGYVYMEIIVKGGIGPFSYLVRTFREMKKLDIAPGEKKYLVMWHDICAGGFTTFIVHVNYENININESNYRNNLAQQIFYAPLFFSFYDNYLTKIGPLRYPLLGLYQLGI